MSALSSLKATQLRTLLTQVGLKLSGNKPQLVNRLQRELGPRASPLAQSRAKQRILSVDMGIKNLAFCVAELDSNLQQPNSSVTTLRLSPLQMHITTWRRISLLQQAKFSAPSPSEDSEDSAEDEDSEPFSPNALSLTAYTLVKDVLLPHKPNTILIERQRFRSANQPSVQEWTLRVNLLEGMIWAVLRALGYRDGVLPRVDVESVLPSRVAAFWVPEKGKVEKEDKIGVVKRWLERGGNGEEKGEHGIRLNFSSDAERTKDAFLAKTNRNGKGRGRAKKVVPTTSVAPGTGEALNEIEMVDDVGKLDDLADCLLQAASWAKWRSNREFLRSIWKDEEKVKEFAESKTGG